MCVFVSLRRYVCACLCVFISHVRFFSFEDVNVVVEDPETTSQPSDTQKRKIIVMQRNVQTELDVQANVGVVVGGDLD